MPRAGRASPSQRLERQVENDSIGLIRRSMRPTIERTRILSSTILLGCKIVNPMLKWTSRVIPLR